jgi:hypothetical protein
MKLNKPNCLESSVSNLSSFCFCLHHILPYINQDKYSYEEIMGYTGHAFHINLRVETINKWGPTMYDWGGVITQGLHNLGFNFKAVGYSGYHLGVPNVLDDAVRLIRDSIQRGVPIIMWEPLNPEFGIIYGYNDESQMLSVVDATKEGEIPFNRIGRGPDTPEFFVLSVSEVVENDARERNKGTLDLILKYGLQDAHDFWEFTTGLPAYETWIKAFNNKSVDIQGNAFNIQVLMNARHAAVRFLDKFKNEFKEDNYHTELIEKSKNAFSEVANLYNKLEKLFLFPDGGYPSESKVGNEAISILQQIKEVEKSALLDLKQLREHLD